MGECLSKVKAVLSSNTEGNYRIPGNNETGSESSTPQYQPLNRSQIQSQHSRRVPTTPISESLILPREDENDPIREETESREESDPSDPDRQMILQLSCPICLDLYTDPVQLPCLHSLCWECANGLWEIVNPFMCPECKQRIGREKLKRNFPLNNLVTIYKRDMEAKEKGRHKTEDKSNTNKPHPCGTRSRLIQPKSCVTCLRTPILFCTNCTMAFCDTCLVDYHPTVESTPEHQLTPVQFTPEIQNSNAVLDGLRTVNGTMRRVHADIFRLFELRIIQNNVNN